MELIKIEHIIKNYYNQKVINDISLTINTGDRIGIVGPNGNGKTTLMEIIGGLRPVDQGKRIIIKKDLKFGMQLQDLRFSKGLTGWDLCQFYLKFYNINITLNELENIFNKLNVNGFINKPLFNLSGGQKQRINIILSLIYKPDIVILDELATGLDIESKNNIYEYVKNALTENKALILVTHTMSEIEMFCKDLYFLYKGQLIVHKKVTDIIDEFGSVENYVQTKFSEYKQDKGNQRPGSNIDDSKDERNEKWKKDWNR